MLLSRTADVTLVLSSLLLADFGFGIPVEDGGGIWEVGAEGLDLPPVLGIRLLIFEFFFDPPESSSLDWPHLESLFSDLLLPEDFFPGGGGETLRVI